MADAPHVDPAVQATADLAAACRAAETTRPAPRLRDPWAAQLLIEPGQPDPRHRALLAAGCDEVIARTVLIDQLLVRVLTDALTPATVVNLGAGLCTRPYRMTLPQCQRVIELDSAPLLTRKEQVLAGAPASAPVQRLPIDLRDGAELTRKVLAAHDAARLVIISEGVSPYLAPTELARLAGRLAALPAPVTWLTDVVSVESARAMAAMSAQAGAPVSLYGLASLTPLEEAGWRVVNYRILPVKRRGPVGTGLPSTGPVSHQVIDGVLQLHRN